MSPKRGSRSMLEVNFPPLLGCHPLMIDCVDFRTGNYRNAKLEISDWTTAGVYDEEDSDEGEESEAESEDM